MMDKSILPPILIYCLGAAFRRTVLVGGVDLGTIEVAVYFTYRLTVTNASYNIENISKPFETFKKNFKFF